MGFPSGVFTPTTKNTGDAIQASHINDLQTEVTAIETGLITGPIQLPQSSLTSLSVSGGSTFSGPVVFSSAVSFGPNGTLSLPTPPSCRLTMAAAVQVAGATATAISWDTERFDASAMHGGTSSQVAFLSTGLWEVGACVEWHANIQGGPSLKLVLDDATPMVEAYGPLVVSKKQVQTVSTLYRVSNSTSFFTVVVAQDSGSTTNIVKTGNSSPEVWAYRVGA